MHNERRRFFRIEDTVKFKLNPIAADAQAQKIDSFRSDHHEFSIRNEFNYKLEQHAADLLHIRKKNPELGRYLGVLQEQIDLLTEKLINVDDDFAPEEQFVSLSAQGISLQYGEALQPDQLLELNLKLMPGQLKIVILARVMECEPKQGESNAFEVSLDFEHIHDADREILVKHVHGKQLSELGAARLEQQD